VLVDEAHRSTGGDLGNYMMGALPNATFVGFTGTPIDRSTHGKGTFKVFGSDDPSGYLDKYSIRHSLRDGTTIPLHYQMAPNELVVDREAMENQHRVDMVASFIAEHFQTFVAPMGYKGFLVAVDREACCLYKEALDRYLPVEMSQVVISRGHNNQPRLRRYYLSDSAEKEVRKAFRKEKLLTGYDAPILYCMYLDKPMRDHVLLQAIARVNRPYEDEAGRRKTNGLIVDFVGIFDNLERALAFDSKDVEGVVEGLDVLKDHFAALMEHGRRDFLPLASGKNVDKAAEAVLEHFRDKESREAFYAYFRELEEVYEILSPDSFLRPFLEDYQSLVEMYRLLRSAYEPHIPVDKSFLRKTAEIVQKHTAADTVQEPKETYEIGVGALLALVKEEKPDTVKVFNLLRELHRLVKDKGKEQPHLIPIGERAEAIRRAFEERQLNRSLCCGLVVAGAKGVRGGTG